MKTFTFALILGFASLLEATPGRIIGGEIDFAQFNLQTQQIETFTPDSDEVNLSTCIPYRDEDGRLVVKFDNYTDWESCQTRKGLKRKIKQLRQQFDSLADFSPAERRDLRQRLDWLISYYQTLP